MTTVTISYEFIRDAMQSAHVRASLAAKARDLAARANSIGSSEGVEINAAVESGTRPAGRPYSNVVSANIAQEWGAAYVDRKRILGRTAAGA